MHNKILIVGDAGRGKTTFAKKLSEKAGISPYSTDDFFYKVKFTVLNDKKESEEEIAKVYNLPQWIMEGTTIRLWKNALEKADIIYLFEFTNIIYQYYFLIKRSFTRKHERLIDLWRLLKHVTYKKYKKGYGNGLPQLKDILEPHISKVVRFRSMKDIDGYFDSEK